MNYFDTGIFAQQCINGLTLGSIYGLIAIGYTMVYGIIGKINFAHGDVYMISAYLTAIFLSIFSILGLHFSILLIFTLVFTIACTSLYGYLVEYVAYRSLKTTIRLAPLISAIGLSIVLQNFVKLSQGSSNQGIVNLIDFEYSWLSGEQIVSFRIEQILVMICAFVCMFGLHLLVKNTQFGRQIRAIEQDEKMCEMLGINTKLTIPVVFMIGAMLAGVAGVLVNLNYGSFNYSIGFIIGIKAFTAAVLGGIGQIYGAMLGGLILGFGETLFSAYASVAYKDVFSFSLLILILIFKPCGILGQTEIEKV